MSAIIFYFSRADYGFIYVLLSLAAGGYLLLLPALKLNDTRKRSDAMAGNAKNAPHRTDTSQQPVDRDAALGQLASLRAFIRMFGLQ